MTKKTLYIGGIILFVSAIVGYTTVQLIQRSKKKKLVDDTDKVIQQANLPTGVAKSSAAPSAVSSVKASAPSSSSSSSAPKKSAAPSASSTALSPATVDIGTVVKPTTTVYKDASRDNTIETINSGKTLRVTNFVNGFYQVVYISSNTNNAVIGYVSAGDVLVKTVPK